MKNAPRPSTGEERKTKSNSTKSWILRGAFATALIGAGFYAGDKYNQATGAEGCWDDVNDEIRANACEFSPNSEACETRLAEIRHENAVSCAFQRTRENVRNAILEKCQSSGNCE